MEIPISKNKSWSQEDTKRLFTPEFYSWMERNFDDEAKFTIPELYGLAEQFHEER
jgi:hypothetical protein